jgi:sec-independent protein translocase protein TatA
MFSVPLIGMPGTTELLIIAFIVMIFFGVGKLPEIGSAMGKAIKGFKDAQKDIEEAPDEPRIEAEHIDEAEEKRAR